MDLKESYAAIPRGKEDRPILLCDPSQPVVVDLNDPDGPFAILNKQFVGCSVVLPFSKPMDECVKGNVCIDGAPVACTVAKASVAGYTVWWMGAKVISRLQGYGSSAQMTVSGFADTDGNAMAPVTIWLRAAEQVLPRKEDAAREEIALRAAEDGIVLMKNDGILPVAEHAAVNLFGRGIHEFRTSALGAGKIVPRYTVGLLEALRASTLLLNEELVAFYACGEDAIPPKELLAQARALSDTAFFVFSRAAGENIDASSRKGDFEPTDEEVALLGCLTKTFPHVVVILNTGYPVATWFLENVSAILYTGFGGMLGGQAIVNVLTGKTAPSGKLPDTWARRFSDIPSSKNMYDAVDGKPYLVTDEGDNWLDTVYEEDIYVGYRYFATFQKEVGFPFGWGLSYTRFTVSGGDVCYDGRYLRLHAEVVNVGARAGREVVQVYLKKPDGVLEKPAIELVEFEKTRLLAPQEMQTFTFCIPDLTLSSFSEAESAYVMEKGTYEVFVGNSSVSLKRAGEFTLPEDKLARRVEHLMAPVVPIRRLSKYGPDSYPKGAGSFVKPVHRLEPERKDRLYPVRFRAEGRRMSFEEAKMSPENLRAFVASLSVKELARLSVCADTGWSVEGTGEAGRLARPDGLGIPKFIVTDGNSGINLKTKNIGMPSGVTLAASFDRVLLEAVGRTIGEEGRALGSDLVLAPSLNIHRSPICGRQPEYFSEDPFLAGKMAASYCRGLESAGVGGCYKHFLCNNTESSRKRNQSILSERALREIYMAAFVYAMEDYMPVSVMTSYNAVNGKFTAEDAELIQGFLRGELGFEGFVMTDWNSYDTASVPKMAAAGNCWITPGSADDTFPKQLENAVREGVLLLDHLRENVFYLLSAVAKLTFRKRA